MSFFSNTLINHNLLKLLLENGFNNSGWNNNNNGGNGGSASNKSTVNNNQPGILNRTWTDASGHRKSPNLWNEDVKSLNGMCFI